MVTLNQRLQKQSPPNRTIRNQYKQMGPQPNLGKLDPQKETPQVHLYRWLCASRTPRTRVVVLVPRLWSGWFPPVITLFLGPKTADTKISSHLKGDRRSCWSQVLVTTGEKQIRYPKPMFQYCNNRLRLYSTRIKKSRLFLKTLVETRGRQVPEKRWNFMCLPVLDSFMSAWHKLMLSVREEGSSKIRIQKIGYQVGL